MAGPPTRVDDFLLLVFTVIGTTRLRAGLVVATLLAGCALPLGRAGSRKHLVTPAQRLALIRRARIWRPTRVDSMDLRRGPRRDVGFGSDATITCNFADIQFGGRTPKFGCVLANDDILKVRYGRDNGEVYANVAATRLLWALGFGADAVYPVRVVCRGCPDRLQPDARTPDGSSRFDPAAVERKFPGREIATTDGGAGWSWPELDEVSESEGGAPAVQRDALKLLAVLLQHTDSKADQQRLVCLDDARSKKELPSCLRPFMFIHDVGKTFGRANILNRAAVSSVNLDLWSHTPVWRDRAHCVGNLSESQTGTLKNPIISEGGRRFLADLLLQLTDKQLHDLFSVARFDEKPHGGGPIDRWVDAFKQKRGEIVSTACPSE